MTDQQNTTEPTTDAPQADQQDATPATAQDASDNAPESQQGDTGKPSGNKGNSEAAKYRTRLRETETERDQLREQLDVMRSSTLDNRFESMGVSLRVETLKKLGYETSGIVNDDLSINNDNLGQVFKTLEADGLSFANTKLSAQTLAEDLGLRDKRVIDLLESIPDPSTRQTVAKYAQLENQNRVNSRVGLNLGGATQDPEWSSLLKGELEQ